MGSNDTVTHLWRARETASINPAFVRTAVSITLAQMKADFEMHLKEPQNQSPEKQMGIRGLIAALPEAQRILTDAMELAVLGQHLPEALPLDVRAEQFRLPKDPVDLRRRIDRMQATVLTQFEMLELPDVPDAYRDNVKAMYGVDCYRILAQQIANGLAEYLGFANGRSGFSPR